MSYEQTRNLAIKMAENPQLYQNGTKNGIHEVGQSENITVGYGYDITVRNFTEATRIFINGFIADSSKQITERQWAIMKAKSSGITIDFPSDPTIHGKLIEFEKESSDTIFSKLEYNQAISSISMTESEATNMLNVVVQNYEDALTSVLAEYNLSMHSNDQRAALISMMYNVIGGTASGIASKIKSKFPGTLGQLKIYLSADSTAQERALARARVWYEIRYNTNGGTNEADKAGLAKRRYYESETFGLYDGANASDEEARAVYIVYRNNYNKITQYDGDYGHKVQSARNDYETTISDLKQSLAPAAQHLNDTYSQPYGRRYAWDQIVVAVDGSCPILPEGMKDKGVLIIGAQGEDNSLSGTDHNDLLHGSNKEDHLVGGAGKKAA